MILPVLTQSSYMLSYLDTRLTWKRKHTVHLYPELMLLLFPLSNYQCIVLVWAYRGPHGPLLDLVVMDLYVIQLKWISYVKYANDYKGIFG